MITHKHYKILSCAALALGLAVASTPAQAAAGVKIGVLTCHEASGWGFVVESTRDLRCVYSPTSGPSAHYDGHISKFGVDVGYKGAGVILWTVIAPAVNVTPDALAGEYVGATGGASVGVGAEANVLVGGSNKSISLQPVSFEGDTGLNVAVGVGALHLKYVPDNAPGAPPPQPPLPPSTPMPQGGMQ